MENDTLLAKRKQVGTHIQNHMEAAGYSYSMKSKQYHTLEPFVYEYINADRMKDNLKIESTIPGFILRLETDS